MSCSFYWSPKKSIPLKYSGHCPSALKEKIERLFGRFPIEFNENNLGKLQTALEIEPDEEAWGDLIQAIEKHGSILVECLY